MFDSLPLMLADATQPAADEVPYKPNAPVVGPAAEQSGSTSTVTQGTTGTTTTPGAAPLSSGQPQSQGLFGGGMSQLVIMVVIIGVMFWVMGASQRKEKKKRAAMLAALKKGDKVQTIGGVIASVVEVREHDVVLKVDDSSNTRIRFTRGAIQTVLDDKPVDTEAL